MNTEKLYEFLILSKTLSYSRAAAALYISQSVLSKHIQEMEKELGTKLFYRTTHGVSLTEAGYLLSRRAARLIDQCDTAVSSLHTSGLPITGSVRIACALELAYASHIQIFVGRFRERYPEIHIDFIVKSDGTPESILYGQDYDFIFTPCEYVNQPSNIHAHLIQSHGTYAALYPGHPLLSKSLIQLRDLTGETILVPFAHELFGPYAQNWVLAQKHTHNRVNCIRVPNLATALFEISLGQGSAIVPRYARNMASGNIFFVGISTDTCRFNEYIYYRESSDHSAARLFYQEFCNTFKLAP